MKKILAILIIGAIVASCGKDLVSGDKEMSFSFGVQGTRVSNIAFETGDAVSLYAVEYSGENAPELQIAGNLLNNEKITYDGSDWSSGRVLYWGEEPCDFYAVYPYQEFVSIEEQPFEVKVDQNSAGDGQSLGGYEASDLLYAKTVKKSHTDGNVEMTFSHVMSKCVVNIIKGENFEGEIPDDIVAHIYNTATSAVLNFAKGTVSKSAVGARKTITMKKISNTQFEAIVVPQNIERRTPLVEITMGGIAYLLDFSLSFRPGYVHTINLTVNTSPDQEKIEISIDPEISGMS